MCQSEWGCAVKGGRSGDKDGGTGGVLGGQQYEFKMQALVRAVANVYERLPVFTSGYEWLRVVTSGCEWLRVVTSGCEWLRVVTSGCEWLRAVASGCEWLRVVASGYEWLRVVASGCEWLRVVTSGCEWLRVVASGYEWFASGYEWLRVVASGCEWLRVVTSGCEWLRVVASGYVRLGKKILGASRETGGWAKAAGVGAAGGALAQSGAKRGMNSCNALLCILSISCRGGRRVSKWREVARIAA